MASDTPKPNAEQRAAARAEKRSEAARKRSDAVGRRRAWLTPVRAAVGAVVVLAVMCYFVFGGQLPWASSQFVLKATFTANTSLHIPSPVRVAGVQVGEVTGVSPIKGSANAGTVTMTIDSSALPIHEGATATIRSRTFLEGNFYVDLTNGAPSAPALHSGATLPASNTAGPVQFDRILSSLTQPVRRNLQTLLQRVGNALDDGGAQALNQSLSDSTAALRASAIVNEALLGEKPSDLAGAVKGVSEVFGALGQKQRQLSGLVTSFDSTMTALADRQSDLSATLAALPGALTSAADADVQLDKALPQLASFSTDLEPALHQLAPTIAVTEPWLKTLTTLANSSHLGALLSNLSPATQSTAVVIKDAHPLVTQLNLLARCTTRDLVPTGNETIIDPDANSDNQKVYEELFQSFVGVTSASQNFDGNGRYVRASTAGGSDLVQTKALPVNGPLFGNAVLSPLGSRPYESGKAPAVVTTTACADESAPNLNDATTGGTP